MTDTTKIRYAGYYSGPSYGTHDYRDGLEGFTSYDQAKDRYAERLANSGQYRLPVTSIKVDADSKVTEAHDENTYWPATTREDTLDLYRVYEGEVASEPFARLVSGPRGGVVKEDY